MAAIGETLRNDLRDPEFAEVYAETFLDTYIATQIKVLREQREMTQAQLAALLGTTQTVVSRIESVNYSSWNIKTLKKIARKLRVRLRVSFETYGSLIGDMERFDKATLQRPALEDDHVLQGEAVTAEQLAELKEILAPSEMDVTRIDVFNVPNDQKRGACPVCGREVAYAQRGDIYRLIHQNGSAHRCGGVLRTTAAPVTPKPIATTGSVPDGPRRLSGRRRSRRVRARSF